MEQRRYVRVAGQCREGNTRQKLKLEESEREERDEGG